MNKIILKKVKCKVCGESFSTLATHINRKHNLSSIEYTKRFPGAKLISDEHREMLSTSVKERFIKDPTLRTRVASRTFDFIKDIKLVPLLQRDYRSAQICLKDELWKPSIILYGSLIEAILIDKYPEAKDFHNALEIAHKNVDISEMENHKIHIIRDLRNYVHLHKELAEDAEINEHWANTAADICESIIKRFRKW